MDARVDSGRTEWASWSAVGSRNARTKVSISEREEVGIRGMYVREGKRSADVALGAPIFEFVTGEWPSEP